MMSSPLPADYQIIALDVGQKRIGVARAHSRVRLVEPLTIIVVGAGQEFKDFQTLFEAYQPALLVIGLPFDKTGQVGSQARAIKAWVADLIKATKFRGQIVYQDETLSTQVAGTLQDLKSPRPAVDDLAACVILNDYLEQPYD